MNQPRLNEGKSIRTIGNTCVSFSGTIYSLMKETRLQFVDDLRGNQKSLRILK